MQTIVQERVELAAQRESQQLASTLDAKFQELSSNLETLQVELTARQLSSLGFTLASQAHDFKSLGVLDRNLLERALRLFKEAFGKIEKHDGSIVYWIVLNNLVFYTSVSGQRRDRSFVLEKARTLKRAAETREDRVHWLLTYCRAILVYSEDKEERDDARALVEGLLQRPLREDQEEEAKLYLASF